MDNKGQWEDCEPAQIESLVNVESNVKEVDGCRLAQHSDGKSLHTELSVKVELNDNENGSNSLTNSSDYKWVENQSLMKTESNDDKSIDGYKVVETAGEDCMYNTDELKYIQIRAGSTFWSKGGTEHTLKAYTEYKNTGPTLVKVDPPFQFGKYISPVKLSRKGFYTTWIQATSAGWHKSSTKKYDKFNVQKWTTAPCPLHCNKGRVMGAPPCANKLHGRALISERMLLIGFQTDKCASDEEKYTFQDFQTVEFQNWLGTVIQQRENKSLMEFERSFEGTTAGPIELYQMTDCIVLESEDEYKTDFINIPAKRATKKIYTTRNKSIEEDSDDINGENLESRKYTVHSNVAEKTRYTASQTPTTEEIVSIVTASHKNVSVPESLPAQEPEFIEHTYEVEDVNENYEVTSKRTTYKAIIVDI